MQDNQGSPQEIIEYTQQQQQNNSQENGGINKINNKLKILDGAVGSLLELRYPHLNKIGSWMNSILTENPSALMELHKEYCHSGADIITTCTFRTNSSPELAEIAVQQAKIAANIGTYSSSTLPIQIFGSNGPAEDCYQQQRTFSNSQLQSIHETHIRRLCNAGVDCIIHETMSHLDEIIIVCEISQQLKIPYILSIYFNKDLQILSGESVIQVLDELLNRRQFQISCVSFNCVQVSDLLHLFRSTGVLQIFPRISFGMYPNCGGEQFNNNNDNLSSSLEPVILPESLVQFYIDIFNEFPELKERTAFIGSCCLSTPAHTLCLSKTFGRSQGGGGQLS